MNGICLIWSRGRLISPSLPVGDDRYLNLSSQKRPTGRNLGGNRLVRRSGTTSRGTVVLVFCLRMRRFPLTLVLTIFVGMKMNCVGSSEHKTSYTRASFLNMRADQSSILRRFLKFYFFKNVCIYLRLIFFAVSKSKIAVSWI